MFICIFLVLQIGACDFCSGFMGNKFFSLSLMLFGGWIGDLCNSCFVGDFALLKLVCVGVVDPMCVFVWTTTLDLNSFWSSPRRINFFYEERQGISSKDSITMNLGKSATSISESDSDRFHLVFLFEDAIDAVYFSLDLCSTTQHKFQLVLGMNQGGNPFTLFETVIHDQFWPLLISGSQHWSNSYSLNAIDSQPPPSST